MCTFICGCYLAIKFTLPFMTLDFSVRCSRLFLEGEENCRTNLLLNCILKRWHWGMFKAGAELNFRDCNSALWQEKGSKSSSKDNYPWYFHSLWAKTWTIACNCVILNAYNTGWEQHSGQHHCFWTVHLSCEVSLHLAHGCSFNYVLMICWTLLIP